MEMNRTALAEKAHITFVPQTKFKSNRIDVCFITPLDKATASDNALVFSVLPRATEKFGSTKEVRVALEQMYDLDLGTRVFKLGDAQVLDLSFSFINDRYALDGESILDGTLALLREFLLCPKKENGLFVSEYVESEKKKLIDAEMAVINNKGRYASIRMQSEMCKGEPFEISENGSVESIAAATPASVTAAYERLLSSAQIEICATGDMDENKVKAFFADMLSGIERKNIPEISTIVKREARENVNYVYEHQSVTQGKLSLGFRTGVCVTDANAYVMQVLCYVFGAGPTSKLFMNVREKLSLCYYCSASLNMQKGFMSVNSGILFENEKKTVDEIMHQLSDVQNGNITDAELDNAKKSIVNSYLTVFDSESSIFGFILNSIMNGKFETIEEKAAKINSVTKDEISEMAKGIKLDTYYFLCGEEK